MITKTYHKCPNSVHNDAILPLGLFLQSRGKCKQMESRSVARHGQTVTVISKFKFYNVVIRNQSHSQAPNVNADSARRDAQDHRPEEGSREAAIRRVRLARQGGVLPQDVSHRRQHLHLWRLYQVLHRDGLRKGLCTISGP